MPHSPPPSDARPTWSRQIQAKYHCVLPPDLIHWFDEEVWRRVSQRSHSNAFSHPIAPDRLLDDAPESIWPALMPCDFLPVIGNDVGDWLCLRFGADSTVTEVVHWYHGGGDWIPWGQTFAEAILFDHLRSRLPGFSRDHAIAAESSVTESSAQNGELETQRHDAPTGHDDFLSWAVSHVKNSSRFLECRWSDQELASELMTVSGCAPAVCCQLVIAALENSFLNEQVLSDLASGIDESQRWLFDNGLIPQEMRTAISDRLQIDGDQLFDQQGWSVVGGLCDEVTGVASHLGWAWELGGYADERAGRIDQAISKYQRAMKCSIFSDQTVRLRTHGFEGDALKFSVARLHDLNFKPTETAEREYLACFSVQPADDRREKVRLLFTGLADQAEKRGDQDSALRYWMRAGWDLGAEPMIAFADLLDHIATTAEASGKKALAALAKTHRACFKDRYRI